MHSSITLAIADEVKVVVPNSINLITPYVLHEQQDWFEDEIKFLRRLLKPGHQVIDIGANYGVYTLSLAHTVGPAGRVWAFEPASTTAAMLEQGIGANGFTNVVLDQRALSNRTGTATLSLDTHAEMNSLTQVKTSGGSSEIVKTVTLDACMVSHHWQKIDFVKIDAEGEEANILAGGQHFFSELSPLVQFEIRAGTSVNFDLVRLFAGLGYSSFQLVPGLHHLVPFDPALPPDGFLLNLFCCKPEIQSQLMSNGFLVDAAAILAHKKPNRDQHLQPRKPAHDAYHWRETIAKLPYGEMLAKRWEASTVNGQSSEVENALAHYAMSRDNACSATDRYCALQTSFDIFKRLCERQPSFLRLASLARVARDIGARSVAVAALAELGSKIIDKGLLDLSEPFLAPDKRFDDLPPGEKLNDWIEAAVVETFERSKAYSSFYTGASSRQHLEKIRALGFGSAEMARRLQLLQARFDRPEK